MNQININQKGFTNIVLVILIVVLAGAVGYFALRKPATESLSLPTTSEQSTNTTQASSTSPKTEKPGWETYQNNQLGFKISYPTEVFKVSETSSDASLLSSYSITDNPSGIPGKEIVHIFSINLELKRANILDTIKTESSYAFSQMFPDGTIESFKIIDGFSSNFSSANRDGFNYLSGAEGINTRYVFLPKDSNETLVVKFNGFDNSVFGSTPPSADISWEKQNKIFNSVIATLEFLN